MCIQALREVGGGRRGQWDRKRQKLKTEEALYISHPGAGISGQEMAQFMADPDLASIFPSLPFSSEKEERREKP